MDFTFNTGYKVPIESRKLNYKFYLLLGKNAILEGFDIQTDSNKLILGPGKAMIEGCIITAIDSFGITIPKNTTIQSGRVDYLYMRYNHEQKTCSINLTNDISDTSASNMVVIRKILVPYVDPKDITIGADGKEILPVNFKLQSEPIKFISSISDNMTDIENLRKTKTRVITSSIEPINEDNCDIWFKQL